MVTDQVDYGSNVFKLRRSGSKIVSKISNSVENNIICKLRN